MHWVLLKLALLFKADQVIRRPFDAEPATGPELDDFAGSFRIVDGPQPTEEVRSQADATTALIRRPLPDIEQVRALAYHLAATDGFRANPEYYWYKAEAQLTTELAP
jgi:hypothetical protein